MILISKKHRFCYIHIPRTGGATLIHLLNDVVDDLENINCETISEALQKYPEINDYYKFAFIRNPYDWLVSMFANINLNQSHYDYKIVKSFNLYDFINWINQVGLKRNQPNAPVYKKQSDYISINNKILVDDIFYYEEMCNDSDLSNINTLFLRLGFDMPKHIPALNNSNRSFNWSYLYNNKIYPLVNRIFHNDFVKLKYFRKYVREIY